MVFGQITFGVFLYSHLSFVIVSLFIILVSLSFGSFLNVVIFRLPNSISIIFPPSSCPQCGNKIKFYDNIPVLSYLILSGKCRKCGNKISIIYPVVELLTALIIYLLFLKYFYSIYFFYKINPFNIEYFKNYIWTQFDYFIFSGVMVFLLIPIAFIDLFHQIIPDILNIILIILGFALNILLLHNSFLFSLLGFLGGGLFFYLIAHFYELLKKKEGLGGGDIKLIAGIGAYIGLKGVAFAIFGGSVLALLGFIIFFVSKTKLTGLTSKIPFGPFLSLAAIIYLFYGNSLISMYLSLLKLQ